MKHTILLVEDELGIRETVKIFLKSQNYNVFKAADGVEGLEVMEREKISLAIVDIMMPRMDGDPPGDCGHHDAEDGRDYHDHEAAGKI